MKTSHLIGIFLLLFATNSFALLPPKYLSVPQFKRCVQTITKGSAQYICLPNDKPAECPMSSWQTLTQEHLVDLCPPR